MKPSLSPMGRPSEGKDRRITVNVTEDTYHHLTHLARMCGKSTSWAANAALEAWIERPLTDEDRAHFDALVMASIEKEQ